MLWQKRGNVSVPLSSRNWNDLDYVCGSKEPRYPVPAIIYEVEYYPDPMIVIVECLDAIRCIDRKRTCHCGAMIHDVMDLYTRGL
jgi:hypothetical protein